MVGKRKRTQKAGSASIGSKATNRTKSAATGSTGSAPNPEETAVDKAQSQLNRGIFCAYVDIFRTEDFKQRFTLSKFNLYKLHDWVCEVGGTTSAPPAVAALHAVCERKLNSTRARRDQKTEKSTTTKVTELKSVRDVLDTQQVTQVLRAAIAISTFASNDERVYELFTKCFRDHDVSSKYIVATFYLPSVLGNLRVKTKQSVLRSIETPSKLEALLFFHCIRMHWDSELTFRTAHIGSRIGFALQKIVNAWARLVENVKVATLGRLSSLLLPYVKFNEETGLFECLKSREDGWSPTTLQRTVIGVEPTTNQSAVSAVAWSRTEDLDTALRFITDMLFTHLHSVLHRKYLYSAAEKDLDSCPFLYKYNLPTNVTALPAVFSELPETICEAFDIEAPDALPLPDDEVPAVPIDVETTIVEESHSTPQAKRPKTTSGDARGNSETTSTVVKNEPLTLNLQPGKFPHMSEEASDAFEIINVEVCKTVQTFRDDFRSLVENEINEGGRDITGEVDFLIADPPYNVRSENSKDNSAHDVFTDKDMEDLVEFCNVVMKEGAHGIIFCAFAQFEDYRQLLTHTMRDGTDWEADSTGKTTKEEAVFTVESSPYIVVRSNGSFTNPLRATGMHVNMAETCVHFWKKGGSITEMKTRLDFNSPSPFGGKLPPWTNVLTDVPQPTGHEVMWHPDKRDQYGGRCRLRPEQKSIELMKFLINKFTKPGDLVCDPCGGTMPAAKACIELDQQRKFIGTDEDQWCVSYADEVIIATYAKQLLCSNSDITSSDPKVMQAAQVAFMEVERLRLKSRLDAWVCPTGLVPIQTFPPHIVEFLCQYYGDRSLYDRRGLSMNRWSPEWVQRMNRSDVRALRAFEAAQRNLVVRKSGIRHPDAGLGVFAARPFAKGETITWYYGTLVYGDLGADRRLYKTYGTGLLAVTSNDYDRWAMQLPHTFVDVSDNQYNGWVVGAPFCVARYINDPRYLDGDPDSNTTTKRVANTQSLPKSKNLRNKDFELYDCVHIVATCDIDRDDELFLSYGTEYTFPQETSTSN